jgi:hypothetical protein
MPSGQERGRFRIIGGVLRGNGRMIKEEASVQVAGRFAERERRLRALEDLRCHHS